MKLNSRVFFYSFLLLFALFFYGGCARKTVVHESLPAIQNQIPDYIKTVANPSLGYEEKLDKVFLGSFNDGWNDFQKGEFIKAERRFQQIVESKPSFFPAWAGLGYLSMLDGKYYDAQKSFTQALSIKQDYLPSLFGLATLYRVMGEKLKAFNMYTLILEKYPGQTEAKLQYDIIRLQETEKYLMLARRYRRENKFEPAFENYKRSLNYAVSEDFLYAEVGKFLLESGKYKEAVSYLQQAASLAPNNHSHIAAYAFALEKAGKLAQAHIQYRKALDLNPKSREIRLSLDRIVRLRKGLEGATAQRDISLQPKVTRSEAAVYIDANFPFKKKVSTESSFIVTDIIDNPDAEAILRMINLRIFEVYPNHTFQPKASLTRIDLALVLNRLVDFAEREAYQFRVKARGLNIIIEDLSMRSPSYRFARKVVALGLMELVEGRKFKPGNLITGAEFVNSINRLSNIIK